MADSDIAETLAERFGSDFGAESERAREAAERAAAFCEEYEEAVTPETVLEAMRAGDAYGSFRHRYNDAVGEVAAGVEGCTDSRAYRLAGFGALAADPEQGA